ncbi:hypothetical protein [Chamaesiphon sp.]|uniref:hypothetical protein n=1 Tax=Chamaesiphon sp. TaxID=2814140 RepID=UPI003593B250
MTKLVYLRMDEWQRSSQNRSGEVFASNSSSEYGQSAQVMVNAKISKELNSL